MNRVTGYKCIFESKAEMWRFALSLKGDPSEAGFAVNTPGIAETLLDMFDDASGCHFDASSGELTFSFDYVAGEDDEGEKDSDEDEAAETNGVAAIAGETEASKAA